MYNKIPILLALAVFLGLFTLPFWSQVGKDPMPQPVLKAGMEATECVEPAAYMRANHMKLLDDWRVEVVRKGERTYVSSTGKKFDKSLTKTCLNCHTNAEQFCDSCHNAVDAKLYCWSCHLVPGKDFAAVGPAPPGMDAANPQALAMMAKAFKDKAFKDDALKNSDRMGVGLDGSGETSGEKPGEKPEKLIGKGVFNGR